MGSATVLLPGMAEILLDAQAPQHVNRWVCYGKLMPNRILRLQLALYVRRPLEHVGQSESGMSWLLDAQKSTAEAIFLESERGKAVLDWIKTNLYKETSQDGGCSPKFWTELSRKMEGVSLDQLWVDIDRRVAAKPKRNPPKPSRARANRPEPLPKKIRDAMKALAEYEAEQYGTKK